MAFQIAPEDYSKIEAYADRLLDAFAAGKLTREDVRWEMCEITATASKDLEGEFWDLIVQPVEGRQRHA